MKTKSEKPRIMCFRGIKLTQEGDNRKTKQIQTKNLFNLSKKGKKKLKINKPGFFFGREVTLLPMKLLVLFNAIIILIAVFFLKHLSGNFSQCFCKVTKYIFLR